MLDELAQGTSVVDVGAVVCPGVGRGRPARPASYATYQCHRRMRRQHRRTMPVLECLLESRLDGVGPGDSAWEVCLVRRRVGAVAGPSARIAR